MTIANDVLLIQTLDRVTVLNQCSCCKLCTNIITTCFKQICNILMSCEGGVLMEYIVCLDIVALFSNNSMVCYGLIHTIESSEHRVVFIVYTWSFNLSTRQFLDVCYCFTFFTCCLRIQSVLLISSKFVFKLNFHFKQEVQHKDLCCVDVFSCSEVQHWSLLRRNLIFNK